MRAVHPTIVNASASPPATPFLAADGRTVVVALDHALAGGQVAPLDRPGPLLARIAAGAPDGLILTAGLARLHGAGGAPWILAADYYATSTSPGTAGDDEIHAFAWDAAAAWSRGAAGLKCLLVFGTRDADRLGANVAAVARLIEEAHGVGLAVMVEPVLWGRRFTERDQRDPALVAHAARAAFELGADVIKIPLPDDLDAVARLAEALPVPLVAMGGPATDAAGLFAHLEGAMAAGIRGVALGRNVWQAPDPAATIRALRALVHDGAPAGDALAMLGSARSGAQP